MENIVELVFTIVVGFFWLFGSTLFKKSEAEPPLPTSSERNKGQNSAPTSDTHETRQREIRESIRRKIAERRQHSETKPVVVSETAPRDQEEFFEQPVVVDAAEESTEGAFSWNLESTPYIQEMEQRVQEIEATKRKAEALRSKVQRTTSNKEDTDADEDFRQESALSVGAVKYALKNPKTVRAAFVYGEVLGKPVGLRNSSDIGSGA